MPIVQQSGGRESSRHAGVPQDNGAERVTPFRIRDLRRPQRTWLKNLVRRRGLIFLSAAFVLALLLLLSSVRYDEAHQVKQPEIGRIQTGNDGGGTESGRTADPSLRQDPSNTGRDVPPDDAPQTLTGPDGEILHLITDSASSNSQAKGSSDETEIQASSPSPPRHRVPRDIGVDTAKPLHDRTAIMTAPDASAKLIRFVSAQDTLALVNPTPQDGWLDVIDVRSGKEGWINAEDAQINLTKHPNAAPRFSEEYTGSDQAPEVIVVNQSDEVLNLKIGETRYKVQPNTQLPLSLGAGTVSFYATVPGAIPAIGDEDFKRGYRYNWRFWVETSPNGLP